MRKGSTGVKGSRHHQERQAAGGTDLPRACKREGKCQWKASRGHIRGVQLEGQVAGSPGTTGRGRSWGQTCSPAVANPAAVVG